MIEALLRDLEALARMLESDLIEQGICRLGAEQELFLVDACGNPVPVAEQVLAQNRDPHLVPELTRFNLELNLDPVQLEGNGLRLLERQLVQRLAHARALARELGHDIALCGILPTIHLSDLALENMTPRPRYMQLNEVITQLRGGPIQLQITGIDELFVQLDSIMVEGCNASFQVHLQVDPDAFAPFYNAAQVAAAPVLAAGANAPVLFGKRLWHETRIAVFRQAIDTRRGHLYLREMSPRVHFGTDWVRASVLEIYREDLARFRVLLMPETPLEDALAVLEQGSIPQLQALQLFNGTVYRWNRACYGVTGGRPHLRIENRVLPAGPTPADEVANAAFWAGLVLELAHREPDLHRQLDFDEARGNFIAAARLGLGAHLTWLDGARWPAARLILEELLPMARAGLRRARIDPADITHYLDIIQERVRRYQTGAEWQLRSLAALKGQGSRAERLEALVLTMQAYQQENRPVHTWELARLAAVRRREAQGNRRVEHVMTTDLFTVHEDEPLVFVAALMDWKQLSFVPVEDAQHRPVGLLSREAVLQALAEEADAPLRVRHVMQTDPPLLTPETSVEEARRLLSAGAHQALLVVHKGQLVGVVTRKDLAGA
ncbi:glutamate-cysteine ligase family protein [Rhodothermus profundi]|uniref:CBS domain-containing protein n=1 Tax=Rhodothermus profundi TaxID=633813 RepID=A0A1M6WTL9_9BACT|nr:glutamate-cysteine ligase family protein [Rhodothermus profundi]SHK96981.1 CBS domain-containing protein [Rhodothermus profundi]